MGNNAYFYNFIIFQFFYFCMASDYPPSSKFTIEQEPFEEVKEFLIAHKSPISTKIVDGSLELNDFVQNSDIPENCSKALEVFVDKAANFTRCSALNAVPISVCRNCYGEYNSTQDAYQALKLLPDVCQSAFFSSNKICIIDIIYHQADALWNKTNCGNCYESYLLNTTAEFFKACDELDTCFRNSNDSSGNNTCQMCYKLYDNVNFIFKLLLEKSDAFISGLCLDVVDKMNITRKAWKDHDCGLNFNFNIGYPNVLTAVLVGTMPVFFYLLAKNVSIIEDVKIVRPKRKSYISIPPSQ